MRSFSPTLLGGDNRSNTFCVKLTANGEQAQFSTANSLGPGKVAGPGEHVQRPVAADRTARHRAFTVDFAFVRDAGFIFERKGRAILQAL